MYLYRVLTLNTTVAPLGTPGLQRKVAKLVNAWS